MPGTARRPRPPGAPDPHHVTAYPRRRIKVESRGRPATGPEPTVRTGASAGCDVCCCEYVPDRIGEQQTGLLTVDGRVAVAALL